MIRLPIHPGGMGEGQFAGAFSLPAGMPVAIAPCPAVSRPLNHRTISLTPSGVDAQALRVSVEAEIPSCTRANLHCVAVVTFPDPASRLADGFVSRSCSAFAGRVVFMRMLTGALLLVGAEQAFAHAHLVQFPNHIEARTVLMPASGALLVAGVVMLFWGLLTENRKAPSGPAGSP
jgi:hypothetical protein